MISSVKYLLKKRSDRVFLPCQPAGFFLDMGIKYVIMSNLIG